MAKNENNQKPDEKAPPPRVEPGSLGWALFRDTLNGGHGPDPIDHPEAHKKAKASRQSQTPKGGNDE